MAERVQISPDEVHESLAAHVLTDGMKLVLDLQASRGSRIVDARSGLRYLDMYTFFASAPLGLNPPGIVDDPAFMTELAYRASAYRAQVREHPITFTDRTRGASKMSAFVIVESMLRVTWWGGKLRLRQVKGRRAERRSAG